MTKQLLLIVALFAGPLACGAADFGSTEFRVRTCDTVITLRRDEDGLVLTQLATPGSPYNWIGEPVSIVPSASLTPEDGTDKIRWQLRKVIGPTADAPHTLIAEFASEHSPLLVSYTWKAHDGPGPIEQITRVKNPSSRSVTIGATPCLALRILPPSAAKLEHWWVEKGGSAPSPIGTHTTLIDSKFHHRTASSPWATKIPSSEPIPWQTIHDTTHLRGLYTVISSSAHVAQEVDRKVDTGELQISLGFDETIAPFQSVVPAGATLTFPPVLIGCYEGDVDDGCNRLHRWAERSYFPRSDDPRLPLLVNNSWGRNFEIDETTCKAMIDDSAQLGFEMYHIDAGWFRDVGWWRVDENKFPRGLKVVGDYARARGLKFGLWVAWTQGGHVMRDEESLCVFHPAMKDWFPTDTPSDWKARRWSGRACCLGSAPAREWCLQELRRIIRENDPDMLEHDQQMITWECSRTNHDHTSSQVDAGFRAAAGYCDVYSALRDEFPSLLLENCVNGGCTVDYGIMQQCHFVSITDKYDPLSNRQAFYDASYPLPPRTLEAYVANYPTPSLAVFRYMLRSGMMGWCTVMIDTRDWSDEQHEVARRQFEIYKKRIRPLIREGNLYHISERPRPDGWDAMQYTNQTATEGVVFVFRAKSPDASSRVLLKGLSSEAVYEVTCEDRPARMHRATGDQLMSSGLAIELSDMESSEILYFVQVDDK